VANLNVNSRSKLKLSSLKFNHRILRFIHFLLILIFSDSIISMFFFMTLLLKISNYASHIQGSNLTYLIATAFILIIDFIIIILSIFMSCFLSFQHFESFGVSLRTFFCFSFSRAVASIILFSNFISFQETQTCKEMIDLCSMNDNAQIDHYASFAIHFIITFSLFIIYCKY